MTERIDLTVRGGWLKLDLELDFPPGNPADPLVAGAAEELWLASRVLDVVGRYHRARLVRRTSPELHRATVEQFDALEYLAGAISTVDDTEPELDVEADADAESEQLAEWLESDDAPGEDQADDDGDTEPDAVVLTPEQWLTAKAAEAEEPALDDEPVWYGDSVAREILGDLLQPREWPTDCVKRHCRDLGVPVPKYGGGHVHDHLRRCVATIRHHIAGLAPVPVPAPASAPEPEPAQTADDDPPVTPEDVMRACYALTPLDRLSPGVPLARALGINGRRVGPFVKMARSRGWLPQVGRVGVDA